MPESFDPYRKWLGIPPKDQPPNHYRLLAIELFEDDADVIEAAADQRMAHVRTYQTGRNSALSQKILNELSAARICLLDPKKKAAYDEKLRQELAAKAGSQRSEERAADAAPSAEFDAALASIERSPAGIRLSADSVVRRRRPAWQVPVVIAAAAALLLVPMIWLTVGSNSRNRPQTTLRPEAQANAAAKPARPSKPQLPTPVAKDRTRIGRNQGEVKPAKQPLSLVADAGRRPETGGVVADRVVLWNLQLQDRGASELSLSLWRDGREVWRKDAVEMPWSSDEAKNVSVPLPPTRFDGLRVEVIKWEQSGGGLSEIEVFRGDKNLARGCPVTGPSWSRQFTAAKLTDGITASFFDGYWLLYEKTPGWAEVDLAFAEPQASSGLLAKRLVIWNTHNGEHNNFGAVELNVSLRLGTDEIWRQDGVAMPWQPSQDGKLEMLLPEKRFDRVRVEFTRWQGAGGGLSEVQVMAGNVNLARACPVITSGCYSDAFRGVNLVDGITSSLTAAVGYWLEADNTPGWAEIDLSPNVPEIGQANRELGQYHSLVEGDWLRGLQWLARSDRIELRTLAESEETIGSWWAVNPSIAPAATEVGDRWWDLAQASSGTAKEELLNRALYRYAASIPLLPEVDRARLDDRVAQCLPRPGGTWLYLLHESEVSRVFALNYLREIVFVRGVLHPWGLWMHPYANESARAAFKLAKRYRRLAGAAAINDTAQVQANTPLAFKVVADGRELWVSQPLQQAGASQPFDVDVSGVDQLQLVVECPGSSGFCHAVWIDPILDGPSSVGPELP